MIMCLSVLNSLAPKGGGGAEVAKSPPFDNHVTLKSPSFDNHVTTKFPPFDNHVTTKSTPWG